MAWVTGEKDRIVYATDTDFDVIRYASIGSIDNIQDVAKKTLNDVQIWAVKPSFTNVHFFNMYPKALIIKRMGIEEFEEFIGMGGRDNEL